MIKIDFAIKDNEDETSEKSVVNYIIDRVGNKRLLDKEGHLHSYNDLPAILISFLNQKKWYKHGRLHRGNGLPAVIYANGKKEWWVNGQLIKKLIP